MSFILEKLLTKEKHNEFIESNDQLADVLIKSLKGIQIEFIFFQAGYIQFVYFCTRASVRIGIKYSNGE